MQISVKLNYLRIAPRKVRLVADLIRGKTVEEAQTILNFTVKKSVKDLLKLLKSAIANAKNNFQLEESNLYISKILVDEGPKYKRWMPRARGQASEIQKKTSHVTIILDEIEKTTTRPPHPPTKRWAPPKKKKKIKEVKPAEKAEKVSEIEKPTEKGKPSAEKAKFKPKVEITKPKIEKGIKRIFRRKAF